MSASWIKDTYNFCSLFTRWDMVALTSGRAIVVMTRWPWSVRWAASRGPWDSAVLTRTTWSGSWMSSTGNTLANCSNNTFLGCNDKIKFPLSVSQHLISKWVDFHQAGQLMTFMTLIYTPGILFGSLRSTFPISRNGLLKVTMPALLQSLKAEKQLIFWWWSDFSLARVLLLKQVDIQLNMATTA